MANENCLEGMQCPECGSFEPFYIVGTSVFTVYDDGTDEHADVAWEDDAVCSCGSCEFNGKVADFKKPESCRIVGAARGASNASDTHDNH